MMFQTAGSFSYKISGVSSGWTLAERTAAATRTRKQRGKHTTRRTRRKKQKNSSSSNSNNLFCGGLNLFKDINTNRTIFSWPWFNQRPWIHVWGIGHTTHAAHTTFCWRHAGVRCGHKRPPPTITTTSTATTITIILQLVIFQIKHLEPSEFRIKT